MPRTFDSIIQALLVIAVIVMSPYAMFATRGCGGCHGPKKEAPGGSGTDPRPATAPEREDPDPGESTGAMDPAEEGDECLVPDVHIPRSQGCARQEPYPSCRWQVPDPPEHGGPYDLWRYTTEDHRWARPSLVALALAAARRYSDQHAGEIITIGDLDAPGERHKTHLSGVDMDIYLQGRMAAENMGKGRYVDNYTERSRSFVEKCRGRVLDLAKILATCAQGRIRIYYNDPPLLESFLSWFGEQGLCTPFEAPMMPHNELHRFHFHVTIPEDLPVLAFEKSSG